MILSNPSLASACYPAADLLAFSLGKLPEPLLLAVAAHLEGCPNCQAALNVVENADDHLVAGLRQAEAGEPFSEEPECWQGVERVKALCRQKCGDTDKDKDARAAGTKEDASVSGQLGQYQLLARLGQGGMGVVYQAHHTHLKRVVALKVLAAERLADPNAIERFRRELEAVGKLHHPNIVHATDAGEIAGTHFLVMEYLKGTDLAQLVKRHGPLAVANACELVRQAALGLHHAHERGLVHRDVKPSNLMLAHSEDGAVVKLLDLGLARLRGEPPAGTELTGVGQILGTYDYMAPEQGGDFHDVDHRADLYSLGCTLYHLLIGHPPFEGPPYRTAPQKLAAHERDPAPPIRERRPDVPAALAAVLERLLAKDPAARFASAAEVATALTPLAAGSTLLGLLVPDAVLPANPLQAPELTTEDHRPKRTSEVRQDPDLPVAQPPRAPVLARHRRAVALAAAVLAVLGGVWLAQTVILRIKSPSGKETVIIGPEGSKLDVGPDGKVTITLPPTRQPLPGKQTEPARETPKPGLPQPAVTLRPGTEVAPAARHDFPAGAPLSPIALVSHPAPLKGVQGWTVETILHRGGVLAVTYHPQGRWLATGSWDGTIRIWEVTTGRLVRALIGHQSAIHRSTLGWSPDGRVLASGSYDRTVRLWETESGRLLRVLPVPHSECCTAWSPDGKTLVVGYRGSESGVQLWDPAAGKLLGTVQPLPGVYALAWSPDGKTLACAGDDTVLLDARTGKTLRTLERHAVAEDVAWSPDGRMLATACWDKKVRLWDPVTGKLLRALEPCDSHQGDNVRAVAWSPDGKTVASSCEMGNVLLAEAATGKVVWARNAKGNGVVYLCWSPDGQSLALARDTVGDFVVWDAGTGETRRTLPGICRERPTHEPYAVWSPDGRKTAFNRDVQTQCVWETASGKRLFQTPVGKSRSEFAAWSPDGKTLAIDDVDDGSVRLVDGESGRLLKSLQPTKPTRDNVFAWSPNSKALAVGGQDRLVHIWNPDTGQLLRELAGHSARIIFVAWSPDGKLLASGAQDNTARLWEADSGKPLHVLSGHGDKGVSLLAFSPDAKILASADEERHLVYLWDVPSGERLGVCEGFAASIRALAWLPDGKTLAAYGADKTLRFWDDTALFLRKVAAGPPTVLGYGAAFSPNRETLACCWLTSVWLHETATGRRTGVWLALPESRYLAVGPDGHYGGSTRVERQLIYVVQTEQGQETLSPEGFTKRYGWKNDPEKVRLVVK